jgi:hypothetical protein
MTGLTAVGNKSAVADDESSRADANGSNARRVLDRAIFRRIFLDHEGLQVTGKERENVSSRLDVERCFARARMPRFIMPRYGELWLKHANRSIAPPLI